MTTTPPEAPSGPPPQDPTGDSGPRVSGEQIRDLGRLRRSITDRKVAGVAGGLGRHLDIDPLVLRVAFVVLVFFGGAGLILYGACWLLVPGDNDQRAAINLDERTRSIVLVVVGGLAALALIGNSWGGAFWFPWPLAVVALIALWLLTRNSSNPATPPVPPGAPTYPPTYAPTYAAPEQANPYAAAPAPAYYPPQPPPYVAPPVIQRVPNPRKRGPILFWFTLALIALAEGILGIADLAGANIASPAYPALAVAICGVMLLVGSFFGRAGGIIAVGLVASVVLAGTTAADRWDGETLTPTPTSSAGLRDSYRIDAGEIVLDLRDVSDVAALDGRTIELDADFGHLEVILPRGLAATVNADVNGPGNIELFGQEHGGIDISQNEFNGSATDPAITINAQLSVGQIEVHR
ncbi:PspC domain-containing protein [Nocardioides conyzicola]|uniref:Phage shock protein PspC N-terminal domain-containing protein n=1 Tax=Nocardioides conyzicola TaxID=1651781 RepID=A0ABP8XQJ7_9ACTN